MPVLLCLDRGSGDDKSNQKLDRRSIQFFVKEDLLEEFNKQSDNLLDALVHGLDVPKENITSYPARGQIPYSQSKRAYVIHVAEKAMITILVSGVERPAIKNQSNMIISLLAITTKFKESEIEIVQVLPSNSCLLVIRLPGLAMVRLIIAFFSPQMRPVFLQRLARVLPESAVEIKFGFASLPDYSAPLPSLRYRDNSQYFRTRQQTSTFDN